MSLLALPVTQPLGLDVRLPEYFNAARDSLRQETFHRTAWSGPPPHSAVSVRAAPCTQRRARARSAVPLHRPRVKKPPSAALLRTHRHGHRRARWRQQVAADVRAAGGGRPASNSNSTAAAWWWCGQAGGGSGCVCVGGGGSGGCVGRGESGGAGVGGDGSERRLGGMHEVAPVGLGGRGQERQRRRWRRRRRVGVWRARAGAAAVARHHTRHHNPSTRDHTSANICVWRVRHACTPFLHWQVTRRSARSTKGM